MKLTTETFVLPNGDDFIVFAPLKGVVMRANRAGVMQLASIMKSERYDGEADPLILELERFGVVGEKGSSCPPPAPSLGPQPYKPTQVTLLLTSTCNLGCTYCYADANAQRLEMPVQMGQDAIDYIVANALELGQPSIDVGFHGGGEPTVVWDTFKNLTLYAREQTERNNLGLTLNTITNGCISNEKARWVADHFDGGTLSWDGPPDVQDAQRPTVGGKPSSRQVEESVQIFDELGFQYGIQSTITGSTVHRMSEIVEYFVSKSTCRKIKFEPVSSTGRFSDDGSDVPSLDDFARAFNEAWDVGQEYGVDLMFSASSRILGKPLCYFCGAMSQPFVLTPDAYITACYEVCSKDRQFDDIFLIGEYDKTTRTFHVDEEKRAPLRERSVHNMDMCQKCFCKYSCAGDCPARNMRGAQDMQPHLLANGQRCDAIREISKHQLVRFLEKVEREHAAEEAPEEEALWAVK